MSFVWWTMYIVQCPMSIDQYPMSFVNCHLSDVHCQMSTVHWSSYKVEHSQQFIVHCDRITLQVLKAWTCASASNETQKQLIIKQGLRQGLEAAALTMIQLLRGKLTFCKLLHLLTSPIELHPYITTSTFPNIYQSIPTFHALSHPHQTSPSLPKTSKLS